MDRFVCKYILGPTLPNLDEAAGDYIPESCDLPGHTGKNHTDGLKLGWTIISELTLGCQDQFSSQGIGGQAYDQSLLAQYTVTSTFNYTQPRYKTPAVSVGKLNIRFIVSGLLKRKFQVCNKTVQVKYDNV